MKIAIIGGGSIGLLFTYFLQKKFDVCLYVRSEEQKNLILKEGITYKQGEIQITVHVKVNVFNDWNGIEDLSIVTVKQYDLEPIINKVKELSLSTTFLFVQNGMGHLKYLNSLKSSQIFVGVVEHGVYRLKPNFIVHTGIGLVRVALYKGNQTFILQKLTMYQDYLFEFQFLDKYEEMLQKKLVVNAVVNPLTAILQVRNGELLRNPYYFELFNNLFEEVVYILDLEKDDFYDYLLAVCNKTFNNKSSMLKDLEENRKTEIDSILGYILEAARNKNRIAPLAHSYFHIIKGKEYEREVK